jgi:hypothetical protein
MGPGTTSQGAFVGRAAELALPAGWPPRGLTKLGPHTRTQIAACTASSPLREP